MLTATGIGSGLDIESLITQLVAAERQPVETRLLRQEFSLTSELSAFGTMKGALASFQNSLANLNSLSTYGQRTATSSNDDVVTISASAESAAGQYNLSVNQLAGSHSLASGGFSLPSDTMGTGTLSIRFGTTDYASPDPGPESYNSFSLNPDKGVATIVIDNTNNTLEGVRDAVNSAGIGVSASIVNDGNGYRLLLGSGSTGEENSLEIRVDDDDGNDVDGAGLSAFAFNTDAINLAQTAAAQDALFTINGLSISNASNTVENVIDGVNINLRSLSGTAPVSIEIVEDRAAVTEAISEFITGYNSFIATANNLTAYDAETASAGVLQGDFSARSISGQLRQVLSTAVAGFNGPFSSLSEIGISTGSDGSLSLNNADLDLALESSFDEIVGLFAAVAIPSDSNIDFVSASDLTSVGDFDINISQLATRGQLTGAAAAFPLTIDDNNDGLTIQIDGVISGAIAFTQGSYGSGDALAAELQSQINGDSAIAAEERNVLVTFNGDHFEIISDRYGTGSKVEITSVDTNSAAQLGLSVAVGTDGLDVAGTIGGVAAIANGQTLTGAVGSDAEGLELLINGGLAGPRGNVSFSRGISFQINTMIAGFLESDGLLDSRTDGLQARLDDIDDQRLTLDFKIDTFEARQRARFNALDGLLAQLESTSSFLTQQLASLPVAGSLLNRN
jgi:flagellar hook-associated protein 2